MAEAIFNGKPLTRKILKKFPADLVEPTILKLDLLNQAARIEDLYFPPSNHLHALGGDRKDQYSIDIKGRKCPWRIVFKWNGTDATDVEIVDYH